MDSILEKFLDAGMLEIDNGDTQYNYLLETAQSLSDDLSQNIEGAIPLTLVSLDADCTPNDPVFEKIEKQLKTQWKLLRRRFTDRPRQLLRAIGLEALNLAGSKNDDVFRLMWLTGSSYLPYVRFGPEIEICQEFLGEVCGLLESAYHDDTRSMDIEELQDIPLVNIDEWEMRWAAAIAAYPYKQKDLTGQNPNPVTAQSHYFPEATWVDQFAPRAANLLVDFNAQFVAQLKNDISSYLSGFRNTIRTVRLQSDMLWWKQSLYSASQRKSYRELELVLAVLAMVADLHKLTPPIYPISVDYLLRETVIDLLSWHKLQPGHAITLGQYLDALASDNYREILQPLVGTRENSNWRHSFLTLTQIQLASRSVAKESVYQRLGVDTNTEIPLPQLAVWLFRDLQAQEIIQVNKNGNQ